METIQVVLDTKLLQAADRVARRRKVNRSALIRDALRSHPKRLHELDLEEQERRAYLAQPQQAEEAVNLHNVVTVSQDRLGKRVASLSAARMDQVCSALRFAVGCT